MTAPTLIAQATPARPEWLEGSVTLPFELVGLVVGITLCAGLIYFALKASRDTRESQAQKESRARGIPE